MATSKTFYYASVDNQQHQLEIFRAYRTDSRDIIIEKKSDTNMREAYRMLRDLILRSGDTLVIMSLDALGQKKEQIKELTYFRDNDISVRVLDIPMMSLYPPEGQECTNDTAIALVIEVLISQVVYERKTKRKRKASTSSKATATAGADNLKR